MTNIKKPQGMSQLDYIWLNFGGYQIGTSPSSIPQRDIILNELAVTSLIKKATNGGIMSLQYKEHPNDPNLVQLIGNSVNGQPITFIDIPKEVHVQSFVGRTVTRVDIDNGCSYPFGTKVLSIVLTNGKEFLVSLESLGLVISGAETNTTISEIIDGKVYTHVKVNKQALSVIELSSSTYGIQAHLNISPDKTGVKLTNSSNGLKARIPLGESGNFIKFDRLSLNAYMALQHKDDFTVYFITDKPYIYVGSQKYGVEFDEIGITSLQYNPKTMTLTYSNDEGSKSISFAASSVEGSEKGGMLTPEEYTDFKKLKDALDGISDVKKYLQEEITNLGASISYGEIKDNKKPLYLHNKEGNILSTVWVDVENYLANSISKKADAEDIVNAASVGVSLEEGDQIMILSLTNGDKHYIKLQDLVVSQSFKDSNSILFKNVNKEISAEVKINENDKILYVTDEGISANIQIVREGRFIKVYGYKQDEKHIIGKFISPSKELQSTLFIPNITEELITKYPPNFVDWDSNNLPILGNDYYLLFYKDDNNLDYIYYLSIQKPLVGISDIEGNLLKRDENGDLFVLFEWIEN